MKETHIASVLLQLFFLTWNVCDKLDNRLIHEAVCTVQGKKGRIRSDKMVTNDGVGEMWQKGVTAYFKVLSPYRLRGRRGGEEFHGSLRIPDTALPTHAMMRMWMGYRYTRCFEVHCQHMYVQWGGRENRTSSVELMWNKIALLSHSCCGL
jgi:hypothetical protein